MTAAAAAFSLATGCQSSVQVHCDDESCPEGAGGSSSAATTSSGGGVCPALSPLDGDVCASPGLECDYERGDESCGFPEEQGRARCTDAGEWLVDWWYNSCNPPPPTPDCPETLPEHGTPCTHYGEDYACELWVDLEECDSWPVMAYCGWDGWEVDEPPVECNPPPVVVPCPAFDAPEDCWAVDGCVWHTPGCGDTPLVEPGCFAAEPCEGIESCARDESCSVVSVGSPTDDVCGVDVALCVPDPSGA